MNEISIKRITVADLEALQKISRQTFFETFAVSNSEADMLNYLEQGFSDEKLLGELQNPNSEFWLASQAGQDLGYLKINKADAQTEVQLGHVMEIERIYVLKEYIGAGVGKLLLAFAIESAKQDAMTYIWLGVWEKNERAIQFYKKNGFVEFGKHDFVLGSDTQTDILMKLIL